MRIAIVGSGVSGLTCAHVLSRHHDVHLFEGDTRLVDRLIDILEADDLDVGCVFGACFFSCGLGRFRLHRRGFLRRQQDLRNEACLAFRTLDRHFVEIVESGTATRAGALGS